MRGKHRVRDCRSELRAARLRDLADSVRAERRLPRHRLPPVARELRT